MSCSGTLHPSIEIHCEVLFEVLKLELRKNLSVISSQPCYITRFTEENFALLIAVIFIKSAIQKVIALEHEFPMHFKEDCFCDPINVTDKILYGKNVKLFVAFNETSSYNKYKCEVCILNFFSLTWQKKSKIIQSCH